MPCIAQSELAWGEGDSAASRVVIVVGAAYAQRFNSLPMPCIAQSELGMGRGGQRCVAGGGCGRRGRPLIERSAARYTCYAQRNGPTPPRLSICLGSKVPA
jgi:hypothetical protein